MEEKPKKLTKKELEEQKALAELAKRILEKRKLLRDEEYFIENYVYIENKDGETNEDRSILFKLFPEQKRVLKEIDDNKNSAIIKARQLGITWLVIAIAVHKCLKLKQFTVAFASQTEDYMHEAINRVEYILQRLPKWLMQEKNKGTMLFNSLYLYEKKADEVTIFHPSKEDGIREESKFKGIISTEKAGRSITGDLIILDEWAYHESAEEVFGAIYPIINRPTSGKFIGLSTNKRGSFFEEIITGCLEGDNDAFKLIFLGAFADPRRTEDWYEKTKKVLKNTYKQEYPLTIEEALSAGNSTAFPEFSREIHTCEPFTIPAHWTKWASVDNGYRDPFAWYKYAISEDGTIYVYYEYTRDKNKDPIVGYKDQAEKFMKDCTFEITDLVREEIDSYDLGYEIEGKYYVKEKLQYAVLGLDAFNRDSSKQTGLSLLDFYKNGGFSYPTVRATTNRETRKSAVHEFLKPEYDENLNKYTAKVQIFNTCKFLINYIPKLTVEDNNPNVVADNSNLDNCLTGDTIINTVNGDIQIKDLVGKNGKVYCYDEENKKPTISDFYSVRCTNEKAEVFEIEMEDGRIFKATNYHPVLTKEGWKTISELTEQDYILDIGNKLSTNYIKIKSIKSLGEEEVYNMEVKDHHNFSIYGGLIVHNCYDSLCYGLLASPRNNSKQIIEKETPVKEYKKKLEKNISRRRRRGVIN